MSENPDIPPIQRLVLSAAGRGRDRAATIFTLDRECAGIARAAREPLMAQIRLAWWRDGLAAAEAMPAHRSPGVDALRALPDFTTIRASLIAIVDGWEELILWDGEGDEAMLDAYAAGRGGGLFAALFPDRAEAVRGWGRLWALWDLAGHLGDEALAGAALRQGRTIAEDLSKTELSRLPRMLAMLGGAALPDILGGVRPPPSLTPGLYIRLLRLQIFGR